MRTPVEFVVISNDDNYLLELHRKYNGRLADVQRRWYDDGNVTRFEFKIQPGKEDGRLVPKTLQVCHVWQAESLVCCDRQVRIKLPSSAGAVDVGQCEPVFAILFGFQDTDATIDQFRCDVQGKAAPFRGSPSEHQFYQQVKQVSGELSARFYDCKETDVCLIVREVKDLHLFTEPQSLGRRDPVASIDCHLVIER